MAIKNFNMFGGQFINELNVYGDLNLGDEKGLNDKIQEAAKEGGTVNNVQGNSQPLPTPAELPKPDAGMIKAACLAALTMKDDSGKWIFSKIYYWQSIFRVLSDLKIVAQYGEFTEMIQRMFQEGQMPPGCEGMYLKHYTNFSPYDDGDYKKPFSEWKKENPATLKVDPRYLVAEKFKVTLDGLRLAASVKGNQ